MRRVLTVVLVLWSAPAFAQARALNSGNEFLTACEEVLKPTSANYFSLGICLAYVQGLQDSESMKRLPPPELAQTVYAPHWKQWCTPDNATLEQAVRVVVKYFTEHPARLHEDKFWLVRDAFITVWPCGK